MTTEERRKVMRQFGRVAGTRSIESSRRLERPLTIAELKSIWHDILTEYVSKDFADDFTNDWITNVSL